MILKYVAFIIGESIATIQLNSFQPFSASPGFGFGAPGLSSPVVMFPNPMVTPASTLAVPIMPSFLPVSTGSGPAVTNFRQFQTTLLRGSSPLKRAEPVLPRTMPSLVPSEGKSPGSSIPEVFISPRNLEIIHHHRLQIPATAAVEVKPPPAFTSTQQVLQKQAADVALVKPVVSGGTTAHTVEVAGTRHDPALLSAPSGLDEPRVTPGAIDESEDIYRSVDDARNLLTHGYSY